jgi:hypothetical protein
MAKEIESRKETPPLSPHSCRERKEQRKEITALHSNSLEYAGIKNESRVFLLMF